MKESQVNGSIAFAKRIRFWVVLVLSIAGAGFYVATTFAKSADVKAVQDMTEFDHSRIDVLEDKLQTIVDDTKYLRDRIDEMNQRRR